ncbi:MAG: ECF-type sigma factor [Acidobacteriota bacterium]
MDRLELSHDITRWLEQQGPASRQDLADLFDALYADLKRRAHRALRRRDPAVTVEATGLVHEAFVRLAASATPVVLRDRRHFLALAARAMRFVLMDTARARRRLRRGAGAARVTLEEATGVMSESKAEELLSLDAALEDLGNLEPRLVAVVEQRFFGGLSIEETAEVLESSPRTVKRDWRRARAFLALQLGERAAGDPALAEAGRWP